MLRVKRNFAWKSTSVYENYSPTSGGFSSIQFKYYYKIEENRDNGWQDIGSVKYMQEEQAYKTLNSLIKNP